MIVGLTVILFVVFSTIVNYFYFETRPLVYIKRMPFFHYARSYGNFIYCFNCI